MADAHLSLALQRKLKFSLAYQILSQVQESLGTIKWNKSYLELNQGPVEDVAACNEPAACMKLSRSVLSDYSLLSKERPRKHFHCKIKKHMWSGFLAVLVWRKWISEAVCLLWHIHKCKPERLSWKWLVWSRKWWTGKTLAALSLFMELFLFWNLSVRLKVLLKVTESDSEQTVLGIRAPKQKNHDLRQARLSYTGFLDFWI